MEEERAYADYTGHDDDGHGGTETITLAQIRAKYDPPLRTSYLASADRLKYVFISCDY